VPGAKTRALAALATTAVLVMAAAPPRAAPAPAVAEPPILVTGQRLKPGATPIPMSGWRMAETQHVLVYSKGSDKEVSQTALRLERLHFLLSMLLNRVDQPDETIKLVVYLIGDGADFDQLRLGHARWQESPYPRAFPTALYYDPRDDGAVIATAAVPLKIVLQPGTDLASFDQVQPDPATGQMGHSLGGPSGAVEGGVKANEKSYGGAPEARLYAGFARHFLLTYFPAAYPRWYLEGFGEIFGTMNADADGAIEYGRAPEGYWDTVQYFGGYRLKDVLSGRYLTEKKSQTGWTPYHAWALAHLLFFSEEWKAPLHRYLAAVASGKAPDVAENALGDTARLQREWSVYHGRKVPFEVLTYPKGRFDPPLVRRLNIEEADYVQARLVLGARVEIPSGAALGAPAAEVAAREEARRNALERRADWLTDLRRAAAAEPDKLSRQLLLAEGACRSGETRLCASAAGAALAAAPDNRRTLQWNGVGALETALAAPPGLRGEALAEARRAIVKANRADTEATVPLMAYYASYADAGEAAPAPAVAGLLKAEDSVPAAPAVAVRVGEALIAHGDKKGARKALMPVARGAYDSPEREQARALLAKIGS
jgi:hypothetical protein